jgi:hypothetical protein
MEDVEPHGPFNKILKFSSGVQAGEMRNVINSTLPTVLHAKSSKVKTADPKCHELTIKSISIRPSERPTD